MWFCPFCGNLLQIHTSTHHTPKFQCTTCPYHLFITSSSTQSTSSSTSSSSSSSAVPAPHLKSGYRNKLPLTPKPLDDVLGGSAAWENVDKTQAPCPKCDSQTAYFMQMQIRSADEPMSIFYKCTQCAEQWNEK